ncbi:hypothetical protein JGU66_21560 [Myxococcaceae bacterium JPH2]|nr:hypothetical protein [Myxococcaceae bacterium JPH2]
MMISRTRLSTALLLMGLLALPGCDSDKGPEQLQKAEAKYQELTTRGLSARDARWDEVVAAFEAVPQDSKARAEADKRLAALRAARGELPPQPLATPGSTGPGSSGVDAKRAACEALAKKLGESRTDASRELVRRALERCHADLTQLEANSHPPGEDGQDSH